MIPTNPNPWAYASRSGGGAGHQLKRARQTAEHAEASALSLAKALGALEFMPSATRIRLGADDLADILHERIRDLGYDPRDAMIAVLLVADTVAHLDAAEQAIKRGDHDDAIESLADGVFYLFSAAHRLNEGLPADRETGQMVERERSYWPAANRPGWQDVMKEKIDYWRGRISGLGRGIPKRLVGL